MSDCCWLDGLSAEIGLLVREYVIISEIPGDQLSEHLLLINFTLEVLDF